jgi:hypothetical protein
MNKFLISILLILLSDNTKITNKSQNVVCKKNKTYQKSDLPKNIQKLMMHYSSIASYKENFIYFKDGSKLIYDDFKQKNEQELINSPDIEDMFEYEYNKWQGAKLPQYFDPGRIRNEEFFKKIYGHSQVSVQKKLKTVVWCPKLSSQKIQITTVNNINEKIDSISREIDFHPEFKKYIQNIGGTFNWRNIKGTKRLSMHSFGMTIDINVKYSNYWQWDANSTMENVKLTYTNKIPIKLVKIFEKYGFIWGGNWYHYDTMHFEYRPELL